MKIQFDHIFPFYTISVELDKLQLSQNDDIFNAASKLFLARWRRRSEDLAVYFERQWLILHPHWHEGYRKKTPSHNNGQESHNRIIKDEHTLRERLELSQFRVVLFSMIEQWSTEYSENLNQINNGAPDIELEWWTAGYNFARSNVKITSSRQGNRIEYKIPTSDGAIDGSENFDSWETFDDFKREAFAVIHTTFDYPVTAENWVFGDCDCAKGFKQFVCEHMIGIALRLKKTTAPSEAKTIPIGQKRAPGRPKKSRPALMFQ